jgi:hypothetical protein
LRSGLEKTIPKAFRTSIARHARNSWLIGDSFPRCRKMQRQWKTKRVTRCRRRRGRKGRWRACCHETYRFFEGRVARSIAWSASYAVQDRAKADGCSFSALLRRLYFLNSKIVILNSELK